MINAVNGQPFSPGLQSVPQGYVVVPEQPWLDGYCAGEGVVRQFVAARLGAGYTAEEQLQGTTRGGIQLEAIPCVPESFFAAALKNRLPGTLEDVLRDVLRDMLSKVADQYLDYRVGGGPPRMGWGAGGRIRQEIYEDPWELDDWELSQATRLWVHLCDAERWHQISGRMPPHVPVTAEGYAAYGLPWYDYYLDDLTALKGSLTLARLESLFTLAAIAGDLPYARKGRLTPGPVISLGAERKAKVTESSGRKAWRR
jgi:hypothetical protein